MVVTDEETVLADGNVQPKRTDLFKQNKILISNGKSQASSKLYHSL